MPKPESFPIEKIFVPTKQRKAIKPEIVGEIAESILDIGQQAPISVRRDGDRLVLVEGLHRLEACKALGETTILGVLVPAELAQHKPQLAERPEVEAERIKMARLKQLRLEKEAAEASAAALKGVGATQAPRSRSAKGARDNPKASADRTAKSTPKSLSDWITQQKSSGGRY
ncbi:MULTISPECIES: ParB N-terminal domain-containing protein [Bradyrhizobium]|uniref:ParB N-terminal domain-containing protein n=1 Tax=Bradyrhizobium TaxID=374 RepID=UPI00155E1C0B|nr:MULTISPECIES: ParB N-terminal domain-containing protein [Bradyrhizobium]MDD1520804.1 chromosome partitioning protein ParB [Bradyrhizobium sp. WBAH30]MDD1546539.1 chromosome partitioning protein ParB [Bradyrhizobium sp. WBAH41]MDD1560233.1 chromosome partitioning protein ParB [Bradyrhizobium sp. WBAH23]MDD1567710.1 chromosome partitioning protein ParB [Bradyrhizobium sp. WBAH33]MDD1592387.1 chromosome partitioning protein ParB [Bradyrhizobium sp. WBAH42]